MTKANKIPTLPAVEQPVQPVLCAHDFACPTCGALAGEHCAEDGADVPAHDDRAPTV